MNDNAHQRTALGRQAGLVGICCNVLLFLGKIIVGLLSGSVSIAADAVNNLSDAASSVVTLVGFRLAEKPADADHPYGHARYEYLSGLAVAALILIIGFELARTSISKLLHPTSIVFSTSLVVVLSASIVVKLLLAIYYTTVGRKINSTTLRASAADSRNDVITTTAVLLSAIVEHISRWQIDGAMGLAVALFILWSGVGLAKQTISPLLGEAADPALEQEIVKEVNACPLVLGYHDLMVHDYGPGQRFASIHVEMDQQENPLVCHEAIDHIERQCLTNHNVHLVIHYDPVVTDDLLLNHLRQQVETILAQQHPALHIHDFRMVQDTLIFDMTIPFEWMSRQESLQQTLEQQLFQVEGKPYHTIITFDAVAFQPETPLKRS